MICIDREATSEFWDDRWQHQNFHKNYEYTAKAAGWFDKHLKSYLKQFVPAGGKILDGGCGTGQYVSAFAQWGYDSYGVDFAAKTVDFITNIFPLLKVSCQDVRNLDFPDNYFDAYYSGGVIEHFWDGYDPIIKEAYRTLKPGGYLFVSVPVFNSLRQLKAWLGAYDIYTQSTQPEGFYQFFVNYKNEMRHISELGFEFIVKIKSNAMLGLTREIPLFRSVDAALTGNNPMKRYAKAILRILTDYTLTFFAANGILMVFRKREK